MGDRVKSTKELNRVFKWQHKCRSAEDVADVLSICLFTLFENDKIVTIRATAMNSGPPGCILIWALHIFVC